MDTNGNIYTIIYSSVMVIVVAIILALAATSLKPAQDRNIENEKKQNILQSVNLIVEVKGTAALFKATIKEMYVVNCRGDKVVGDAFTVNLKVEHSKKLENRLMPVYVADLGDKGLKYVIPLRGTGLWGPIWGYISLDDNMNTIYGTCFDHQGETPGLGAEINTGQFQRPFAGKSIFDETGKFTSIIVAKTGEVADPKHKVDAISGGTITSKALQQMLYDDLVNYQEFFKKTKK